MTPLRNILWLCLLGYLAAVANAAISPRIAIGPFAPNWLAVLAVVWITFQQREAAVVTMAVTGLVFDLGGSGQPGVGTLCFLLVGAGLEFFQRKFARDQLVGRIGVALPAAVLLHLLLAWLDWLGSDSTRPWTDLASQTFAVAAYSVAAAVLTCGVLRLFGPQRHYS